MTESMAEIATGDMIAALKAQRAALLDRKHDTEVRMAHLVLDEEVSFPSWTFFIKQFITQSNHLLPA